MPDHAAPPTKPSRKDIIEQAQKLHKALYSTTDPAVAISLIAQTLARGHMLSLSHMAEVTADLLDRKINTMEYAKILRELNTELKQVFQPWDMV
jgi:RES domain-containing protein